MKYDWWKSKRYIMSMKYDIVIKDTDGKTVAEFIVGEQTVGYVVDAAREGVNEGDGHEVPKEDI